MNKGLSLKRLFVMSIIATLIISSLTGCGKSNKDKKKVIGVTTVTLRHQFFIDIDQGIREAAKEANVELIVNDSNVDPQKQTSAIEDFIQKGVDGMVVIGTDPSAIVPAVEEANKKIPVATVDMKLTTDNILTFIGTENKLAGKQLGDYTKKYIQEKLGGKAKIAVVSWLESSIQQQRIEGFKEAFKDMPNVKILNAQPGYDREKSLNTVENILQAESDVNIIYATAENSVLGTLAAIDSAKKDKVKIVGFDLTKEAGEGIKSGKIIAMIQQQPKEMGKIALKAVLDKISGKVVNKNISIDALLYDNNNIDKFLSTQK